ncbi:hypothetical protein [Pontibacter akesuensis]|uniref:Secreted protein n=1 Tax=Pontibacter akesuensis TaxID=388950 RepID=A0A1I7H2T8_9BACT|nr:hypothetical protein [Pontibacter akesuensis]GHA53761.1 hypothetical protein GCM10007389_01240 [Pontibacter akesuensis]SFU55009.1 hypothetical protein SAMN04487941_1456 [Pontibacter akesuensis]
MKFISSLVLSASALFLLSCSGGENTKYNDGVTASPPPATATTPATPGQPLNMPQTQTSSTATAGAVNPAHGEPNHRCDIPVGAPLSTPVQPSLNPVVPGQTVPQFNPQAGATAPGMNPPHGQPGHDCAIPVGAPLNK